MTLTLGAPVPGTVQAQEELMLLPAHSSVSRHWEEAGGKAGHAVNPSS